MIAVTALTEEKRTPKNGKNKLPLYLYSSEKLVSS